MSTGSTVCVPLLGATWLCRTTRNLKTLPATPRDRIISLSIGGHWVDAEVVLDALFLDRLEAVLNAMPSNSEPNLSWPRSIA